MAPPIALTTRGASPVQPRLARPAPFPPQSPGWPRGRPAAIQLASATPAEVELHRATISAAAKQVAASVSVARGDYTVAEVTRPGDYNLAALHTVPDNHLKTKTAAAVNAFRTAGTQAGRDAALATLRDVRDLAVSMNDAKHAQLSALPNVVGKRSMVAIYSANRTKIDKAHNELVDGLTKGAPLGKVQKQAMAFHTATAGGPHNVYDYGDQPENARVSDRGHAGFESGPKKRPRSPGTEVAMDAPANSDLPWAETSDGKALVSKYDEHARKIRVTDSSGKHVTPAHTERTSVEY